MRTSRAGRGVLVLGSEVEGGGGRGVEVVLLCERVGLKLEMTGCGSGHSLFGRWTFWVWIEFCLEF